MKTKVNAEMMADLLGTRKFVLIRLDIPELLATDVMDLEGYTLEGGHRERDLNEEEFDELVSGVVASVPESEVVDRTDLSILSDGLVDGIGLHWLGNLETEDWWEMLMLVAWLPPTVTSEEPPEWQDLSIFVLGAMKEGLDLSKTDRDKAYDDLYYALRIEWHLGGSVIGMAIRDESFAEEVDELPEEVMFLEGTSRFYSKFYPNRIRYRGECPEQEAEEALDDLA